MMARLVLSVVMTSVMVLMVTLVATYLNLGFVTGFFGQWMKAYFIGWPIAAGTGFVIMPAARSLTERILASMQRTA